MNPWQFDPVTISRYLDDNPDFDSEVMLARRFPHTEHSHLRREGWQFDVREFWARLGDPVVYEKANVILLR